MTPKKDYYGNRITLPVVGDKVLRDGYLFTVSKVLPHNDIYIIASISLKGEPGEVEIGYYDFIKLIKA